MRKILFFVILSLMASFTHAQTLDTTIGAAATELSGRLPRGSTVVMIEFETSSEELANHVIDEMNHKIVTIGLIRPVERRRLNTIRSELSLNTQGEIGDDFAQRIGHMLGAQHIILGSISSAGNQYILRFRAITTETATIVWSFSQNIRSDTVLENFLRSGGTRTASSGASGQSAATLTAAAPAAAASTSYKVGDTGPAGGLIFYDKGNNSGGWLYLEAAPADITQRLFQTSEAVSIESQRTVGTGKANTQAIMIQANNLGGGFGWAAQACATFTLNGFDDWFLPSRDELNFMYGNLHMRNLGGFSPDRYWSSTFDRNENSARWWWGINFSDGGHAIHSGNRDAHQWYPGQQLRVRPIRQF